MAKEVVTLCDECGKRHEDTRTYRISVDGETWEVDLGGPHSNPLTDLMRKGRQLGDSSRRNSGNANLNRRIRNTPDSE